MKIKMKKGVVITIVIIAVLLVGGIAFQFLKKSAQPQSIEGDEILEIKVTMDNGVPLGNLEVDLWKAGSTGSPDAGYNFTDSKGIIVFNIPEGEYEIGFNGVNFPENLEFPERTYVLIETGIPASETILIKAK